MASAYQAVMESRKGVVNQLLEMMDGGFYNNPELWVSNSMAPYNPESKSKYQGGNRLRLMLTSMVRGYEEPRWCTFKQIQDAGYKLDKASKGKGVLCEKWIFPIETYNRLSDEKKAAMSEVEKEQLLKAAPRVNYFYLFNMSYVNDYPELPKKEKLVEDDILTLADELIQASECKLIETPNESGAYYVPRTDEIHLPSRNDFKSSEAFLSVLLHEQGHSTGHVDRLNRDLSGNKGSELYAKEELRAELSTLFTSADLGVTPSREGLEDTSNYIKSWLRTLDNNPKELFDIVKDADSITKRIVANHDLRYPRDKSLQANKKPKETRQLSIRR